MFMLGNVRLPETVLLPICGFGFFSFLTYHFSVVSDNLFFVTIIHSASSFFYPRFVPACFRYVLEIHQAGFLASFIFLPFSLSPAIPLVQNALSVLFSLLKSYLFF